VKNVEEVGIVRIDQFQKRFDPGVMVNAYPDQKVFKQIEQKAREAIIEYELEG
jgi:hypothetical protein